MLLILLLNFFLICHIAFIARYVLVFLDDRNLDVFIFDVMYLGTFNIPSGRRMQLGCDDKILWISRNKLKRNRNSENRLWPSCVVSRELINGHERLDLMSC